MNLWGLVMAGVGCFFLISGWLKSDFFIYRIFVARSKTLWGDKVHVFFQFVGIAIIVVGALMAIGRL
jgi:hypothetical protein